jgi:GT2 family glycosyltransferase
LREEENAVTVVIPNYNGMKYIKDCLDGLLAGSMLPEIIVVDNASDDGSFEFVRDNYPQVTLLRLKANTGFCHAVNSGLRITRTEFVMLLNNDTKVDPGCVRSLYTALIQSQRAFSVQAKMLSMQDPDVIDDAGDLYCALGWGFARGKAQQADRYDTPCEIFSACAGAAMYRRGIFDRIGYFDERHFCYLEDVDIGYRARIWGYHNLYEPSAIVLHAGSASSGAVHNAFKERMTAGNNRYLLWKNMPAFQYVINLPLILAGERIKQNYFARQGLGDAWRDGLTRGSFLIERAKYGDEMRRLDSPEKGTIWEESGTEEGTELIHPLYLGGKVPYSPLHFFHYFAIQFALWKNMGRRLQG